MSQLSFRQIFKSKIKAKNICKIPYKMLKIKFHKKKSHKEIKTIHSVKQNIK